jgi:tetratricopeptide (TPR) repeat protein
MTVGGGQRIADAAIGLDRTIDTTGYSPIAGTNRGTAPDRVPRSPAPPREVNDGLYPDVASLIRHGAMKLEMGNDAEAEECFRKALEIGDRTVGPEHPDLMLLLNDLTRIYLRQSAYAVAEPLLLRLLEMKRNKGEDHPEVATVMASLATVRQALGRHESAEQLWRRVLDIRERTLAPNHFAIATALEHFGESCAARGKIREALVSFQRAHTIRERTLGSDHSSLQSSRERIADLQLQASDGSLDPNGGAGTTSSADTYRLLSGEPLALAAPVAAARTRERRPAPIARKTTVVIQAPFSDSAENENTSLADEVPANDAAALQRVVVPYRDALESIREEVETPYGSASLSERAVAIFAPVLAFLGRRQVVAGIVVLVIASLLIAVATDARGGGEINQATALGAALPTHESSPVTGALTASAAPAGPATRDPVSASGSTPANAAPKAAAQRPRVADERNAPKKVTEEKSDSRKLAIPTLSAGIMSRMDSVASRAAGASSRAADPFSFQPAPSSLGTLRTNFESEVQSSPQRARLIGELPTPRVPFQIADIEGEVRVRFNVDVEGRPVMTTLSVIASPDPLLTAAVRKVISGIRFEPAQTGGPDSKPVGDVVQIGFRFAKPIR